MKKMKWMNLKRLIIWGLICLMMLPPLPIFAGGSRLVKDIVPQYINRDIAPNTLPVGQYIPTDQATLENSGENSLTVHQEQDKAILEWVSFDVGEAAHVHFDQQGRTDWRVLNRIFDQNPSCIMGKLTADGAVFMINPNGILFGANSVVNTHDLVASTLDIDTDDFLADAMDDLHFTVKNFIDPENEDPETKLDDDAIVENWGAITVDHGGTVYLVGRNVTNGGTISAEAGQVLLAAADELELAYNDGATEAHTKREIKNSGNRTYLSGIAENTGEITTSGGRSSLFADVVNQNGIVRAEAAVEQDGQIYIEGRSKVTFGAGSKTECPIQADTERVNHEPKSGDIQIKGEQIEVYGNIAAPSGSVLITATPNDQSSDETATTDLEEAVENDATDSQAEDENTTPRIFLGEGSSIDVSGEEVYLPASSRIVSMQLNSVQLRDDYGQKEGELQGETITFDTLTGTAIGDAAEVIDSLPKSAQENNIEGGAIVMEARDGEIIQQQGSTLGFKGGAIHYDAGQVETTKLIAGRRLYDIDDAPEWLVYSGTLQPYEKTWSRFGVVESYEGIYTGGSAPVTRLSQAYTQGADAGSLQVAARRVVLEGSLAGEAIVGPYQTEELDDTVEAVTVGKTRPKGGVFIMGKLSWADFGLYQSQDQRDPNLYEVLITSSPVTMTQGLSADDPIGSAGILGFSQDVSLVSDDMLNNSGLEDIQIYAATRVATEAATQVNLPVGGTMTIGARNFEHHGDLVAPSGTVTIQTYANNTSYTEDAGSLREGIFLASGSRISVAGVETNLAQNNPNDSLIPLFASQAEGGTLTLHDVNYLKNTLDSDTARRGEGVIIAPGAILDVSGGYTIEEDGALSAGDAGYLDLKGSALILAGDIKGHAIAGADGGELSLHALNVEITAEAEPMPEGLVNGWQLSDNDPHRDHLLLSPSELADTGFSKLSILSEHDLKVGDTDGTSLTLAPSYVRTLEPQSETAGRVLSAYHSQMTSGTIDNLSCNYVTLPSQVVKDTKISLAAGVEFSEEREKAENIMDIDIETANVNILPTASIVVSPGGSIDIAGPNVTLQGLLQAHGGDITVSAAISDIEGAGTLALGAGARIDASGILLPDLQSTALLQELQWTPMDAGSVTLVGQVLDVQPLTLIDIGGSAAVDIPMLQADGTITYDRVAGSAGDLSLTFAESLAMGGTVKAPGSAAGGRGAGLSIQRTGKKGVLDVNSLPLEHLLASETAYFDALTLSADQGLFFSKSMELQLDRKITLDTPFIQFASAADGGTTASQAVTMQAPWVSLTNTSLVLTPEASEGSNAILTLLAQGSGDNSQQGWLDVSGEVHIGGFQSVNLSTAGDMVLSEQVVTVKGTPTYFGSLETDGLLSLTADRIYPAAGVSFTISTPERLEIHQAGPWTDDNALTYSAGGSLVLAAEQIHNYGTLLAPMGEIVIKGYDSDTAQQVYLAPGSRIATKGGEDAVNYGYLADAELDSSWAVLLSGEDQSVTEVPEKQLTIQAEEVIQATGAQIDASGGGSVFAYGWTPGIEGSSNPLAQVDPSDSDSKYIVILPGAPNALPGEAIYLKGGNGLAEGLYTKLPAEYAFLPGAMILEARGQSGVAGLTASTVERYSIVQGYDGVTGTDIRQGRLTDYALRTASDLLAQGRYNLAEYSAGEGGLVTVGGDTILLSGTILGSGEDGYAGGVLELTGRDITFSDNLNIQAADFNPYSTIAEQLPVYADLKDTLSVSAAGISEGGFDLVQIGKLTLEDTNYGTDEAPEYHYSDNSTRTITISAGTELKASNLVLEATDAITIQGDESTGNTVLGDLEQTDSLTLRCAVGKRQLSDGTVVDALVANEKGQFVAPSGSVSLAPGADLQAVTSISLDAPELDLSGGLTVQNSTIKLYGDQITFANSRERLDGESGLIITPELWGMIATNETIELLSRSDVRFDPLRDATVDAADQWYTDEGLSIDAGALVYVDDESAAPVDIVLSARTLELRNTMGGTAEAQTGPGGALTLSAQSIVLGRGDVRIDGFDQVMITAAEAEEGLSPITFTGSGGLSTEAGVTLTADVLRTDLYRWSDDEGNDLFEAADYEIHAGSQIAVVSNGGELSTELDEYQGLPGALAMTADQIDINSVIQMPAGTLQLTAGGGDSEAQAIRIGEKARILLAGDDSFAGGTLALTAQGTGDVEIASGSKIELDAGTQGDAGNLSITVEGGGVNLGGTISAKASTEVDDGTGGSFSLDAAQEIRNVDTLLAGIQESGFTREIAVRTSSGNLTVGQSAVQVSAEQIRLAAAGGALTIGDNATLTARGGESGGLIELLARDDLTINSGAGLVADAPDGQGAGGRIYAASVQGSLTQNGYMSVKAGSDGASGGTVHFRAQRLAAAPDMVIAGTIDGAARVTAEAVQIYDGTSGSAIYDGGETLTIGNITSALAQAGNFLDGVQWTAGVQDSLGMQVDVDLVTGIEFHGAGNVTISGSSLDLASRDFGGTLTVRAKGDLTLAAALQDTGTDSARGGWDLLLAAGADVTAVDRYTTTTTALPDAVAGDLTLNNDFFSEYGSVGFASSGKTTLSSESVTVGSAGGSITGAVGGDLLLQGGIIESETGAITLAIADNLIFDVDGGAIRTKGTIPTDTDDPIPATAHWERTDGGAIDVTVGGDIDGSKLLLSGAAWDDWSVETIGSGFEVSYAYHYTADYSEAGTQGIAAMAGGDVTVNAGGNITGQVGAFGTQTQGGGDLRVRAGGNLVGRYLVRQGDAELTALGNIGGTAGLGRQYTTLELAAVGEVTALAVGSIELDAVLNPTVMAYSGTDYSVTGKNSPGGSLYLSYETESSLQATALEGSIRLKGDCGYYYTAPSGQQRILPPNMALSAGNDIYIDERFVMAPSPTGSLALIAGGSISAPEPDGSYIGRIDMVDWDLASLPDVYAPGGYIGLETTQEGDARTSRLHDDDSLPVVIFAGGNIEYLSLSLPKQARNSAGGDIIDLWYTGQNLNDDDFSLIHADGDILQGIHPSLAPTNSEDPYFKARIEQGGPGTLLVQAGETISLGASRGIVALGNQNNTALADSSAMLAVVAGYDLFTSFAGKGVIEGDDKSEVKSLRADLEEDIYKIGAGLESLFEQIRNAGQIYSELLAEERKAEAAAFVEDFRENVLYVYLPQPSVGVDDNHGDIDMVNSRIKTVDDSDGIYIVTAGDFNVGLSSLPEANATAVRESGVFTEFGGGVNVVSTGYRSGGEFTEETVVGNINVNESRIMTFNGGDLTIWADKGDINAGRGSKGNIINPDAETPTNAGLNRYVKYKPPIQGSGVRSWSFDPDGANGPLQAAKAGDGYIFAPDGEIDAGEAGISVTNIFLAAVKYANVQNIEVAGASVGLPVMADTMVGMDAFAGDSSVTEAIKQTTESVAGDPAKRMEEMLKAVNDNLVQILNVEVVGFGKTGKAGEEEKDDKKK